MKAVIAIISTVLAMPAAATTTIDWDFGSGTGSGGGASNVAAVASTRHGITLTATARLFSLAPGTLTDLGQTRTGALIRQTSPGIGVAGGGSPTQLDTNNARKREAILVTASRPLALSGLRLSSIDSNDTLQLYGVAADGSLTSFGFGGVIRSGLRGVRAPLNNLDGAATGSFVQGRNEGTSELAFAAPLPRFDRFLFTTHVAGDTAYLGAPGQGYRIDRLSAAVPEPASWGLMIIGFGAIGSASRRRRGHHVTA